MKKCIFLVLLIISIFSCTKDEIPKSHLFPDNLPGKYIVNMALDSKGGLWFVTSEIDTTIKLPSYSSSLPIRAYLTRFHENSFEVFDDRFIGAQEMTFDKYDRLWFFTGKKLYYLNDNKYVELYELPDDIGLFRWITTDQDKNIWVGGLNAPLLKITVDPEIKIDKITSSSLPTTNSTTGYFDKNNTLWLALWDNGIGKMDNTGRWTIYNPTNSSLPYQNFWCITSDKNNDVWAGTGWINTEVNLFKFSGSKWEQITPKDDKGNTIYGTIRQLYSDNNKIWIVSETSVNNALDKTYLITFDGTGWNRIYNVPSDDGIADIEIDLSGQKVWIGTMNNGYIDLDLE
jgi:ligand-binding sensor domain-containing protein